MGILEKEAVGDFKREKEVEEGYKNRSTLSVEDRLRLMWREDIYGRLSPELTAVSQCSAMAILMGKKVFFYFILTYLVLHQGCLWLSNLVRTSVYGGHNLPSGWNRVFR